MKRAAAISLLVLFLSANTIFGELLRLPVLVHHYCEHIQWDNNASLLDFLAIHYTEQINHPDDQHRDHENLPFKTIPSMLSLVFLPKVCIDIPVLAVRLLPQIKTVNKPQPYTIAYLGSIWHPPCI